jgi:tetratricopeptide (TPR) repeat protein
MADLYLRAGDADKSKQKIDQAQKIAPNSQTVIHARLGWLVSQSRWEELKGISSVYLAAKEQDPALLVEAGLALVTSPPADLKKEGVRLLEQAATLAPASAEARLNWASALYQTGEPDRAEKTYREWLAQHPNDGRALNDLAWILQEYYHRYDAALELANKGLRFAPDDMNLLDTRGTILTNLPDRLADARSDFAKLAELLPAKTPGKAKTLLRLGRLCSQLNDLPQAKQHLQTALDIDRELHVFTTVERSEISQIMQQSGT